MVLDEVQSFNHLRIAGSKGQAPTGHVKRLWESVKFDADVLCTRSFKETRIFIAVKAERSVCKVADDADVVFFSKSNRLLPKLARRNGTGRIIRIVEIDELGFFCNIFRNIVIIRQEVVFSLQRHRFKLDLTERNAWKVVRIAWIGQNNRVARIHQSPRQFDQPDFGTSENADFFFAVEFDAVFLLIKRCTGFLESRLAAKLRVLVVDWSFRRFFQAFDDVVERRLVRIALAEIDNVVSFGNFFVNLGNMRCK